jgi:hypothetical protein
MNKSLIKIFYEIRKISNLLAIFKFLKKFFFLQNILHIIHNEKNFKLILN